MGAQRIQAIEWIVSLRSEALDEIRTFPAHERFRSMNLTIADDRIYFYNILKFVIKAPARYYSIQQFSIILPDKLQFLAIAEGIQTYRVQFN